MDKKNTGCFKVLAILAGVMLVFLIGLFVWGYQIFQRSVTEIPSANRAYVEKVFSELRIPDAEKAEVLAALNTFNSKIENDELGYFDTFHVIKAIDESAFVACILAKACEKKYIMSSQLSDDEKSHAILQFSRFTQGVSEGKLGKKQIEALRKIVLIENEDENGFVIKSFKKSLSSEELKQCVDQLKLAADRVKIENRLFMVDLSTELQKAIDKGLGDKKGNS